MEGFLDLTVDLQKTENYVINVDPNNQRYIDCVNRLKERGVSCIRHSANTSPSPPGNPYGAHFVGCAKSHLALLETMEPGTLVLEDDVVPTEFFTTKFSVPFGTDAVYLGISNHGTVRNNNFGYPGIVMASQYSRDFKRVYNMCGTHAMLYLSQRYILIAANTIRRFLDKLVPCDVALASIHKDFKILTPNEPFLYQEDQPDLTNFTLEV